MGGGLHPAIARVRLGVRAALADLDPGDAVVVAVSGGADSLALASAAVFEGHKLGLRLIGATVDHGLQEGSAEQAARVVGQLARMGVDETVSARVSVEGEGMGPEAAARRARYAVLGQIAERFGARLVLLGHTRDDQAETVLLGLTHGSGGRSLAGMRRWFDDGPAAYARPLLDVPRDDTVTACLAEGLEVWEDPHNADPGYARVRVRTRVMPVLEEELGPGIAEALARTAPQLRADMDHLDDLARAELSRLAGLPRGSWPLGGCPPLSVEALGALAWPIRSRVLRLAALAAGGIAAELTYDHVLALDALVTDWRGQRWIELPGHLRATREDGMIHLASTRAPIDG
jgi:tRNA(Ile)-lysidine synthase